MILSGQAIHRRLTKGQIFKKCTWDEDCLMEASYALRVDHDGLMVGGKRYRPGGDMRVEGDIMVEPGEIAILSTMERLNMPGDLVGKIGIRFDYASLGLTGLMGIQVDPFYGWGHADERLYIRVANLGNESICIPPYKGVFTFELHKVSGYVPEPSTRRIPMWHRIQEILAGQREPSWSYVTRVQSELSKQATEIDKRLESETKNIRDYLQPVVMFGIFLIAVTILGVAISLILSVNNDPKPSVPDWVPDWGWAVLLLTLSIATVATAAMGTAVVFSMAKQLWKQR